MKILSIIILMLGVGACKPQKTDPCLGDGLKGQNGSCVTTPKDEGDNSNPQANIAPIANPQTINRDVPVSSISFSLSATDSDGDPLTISIESNPQFGTLSQVSGFSFQYFPDDPNRVGQDLFTFRVNDGQLNSNIATVKINTNDSQVNNAPQATGGSFSTTKNQSLNILLSAVDLDGDSLTYSIIQAPASGVIGGVFPNIVYTPSQNFTGQDVFTFRVNDGQLNSNIATVNISVLDDSGNTAPVAIEQNLTTPFESAINFTLTATDLNSDPLSFILTSFPTNGVLSGTLPNLTFTPNDNFSGNVQVGFKANDGQLDSPLAYINILVLPEDVQNNLPVSQSDSFSVDQGASHSGNLVALDADGDSLTYIVQTLPTKGILNLNSSTGAYSYSALSSGSGSDFFTYKVNDGQGDSNVSTVTISINQINQNSLPIAQNQTLSIPEDSTLTLTLTAVDVDADSLSYTVVTNPANGSLSGSAPNLTYTPNANFNGSDSFSFKANDGAGDSNIATVLINVTPVNDAPIAQSQSIGVGVNSSLNSLTLLGSDIDDVTSSLVFQLTSQPTKGVLSGSGANLFYTPLPNEVGNDFFTFKVVDPDGLESAQAIVSISISGQINFDPVALDLSFTISEDSQLQSNLVGVDNDVPADTLSYQVTQPPANGNIANFDPQSGSFTYIPGLNFSGSDQFSYKVNDGQADSSIATISIEVLPVNDAPIAQSQNLSTGVQVPLNILLTGSDVDGDPLTYSLISSPTLGSVSGSGENLVYTPGAVGVDYISFKVNDGVSDSNVGVIQITVIGDGNNPPVATSLNFNINKNTSLNNSLVAMDTDGDQIQYSLGVLPINGSVSIDSSTGVFTYVPNNNFIGNDQFSYKVNDGQVDSNIAYVSLSVQNLNQAPISSDLSFTISSIDSISSNLIAQDIDGDVLSYSLTAAPLKGSLNYNPLTGAFVYQPFAASTGVDSFSYKVNDGQLDSNIATVSIEILDYNNPPIAIDIATNTIEDSSVALTLVGSDVDGDALTYILLSPPSQGTLSGSAPNLSYTPSSNFSGTDQFSYKVNDGQIDSNIATVSIQVQGQNDAPVANDQVISTGEETSIGIVLSATDLDGDSLTFQVLTSPINGTISGSGQNIVYTPNNNFQGEDYIFFKANDGQADSNIAKITILVNSVNDAPVASDLNLSTLEDVALSFTLSALDPEGDTISYSILSSPSGGVISGSAPNLTYTPNANFNGSDSFTYKVNDGQLDSNVATVSFQISSVNDAPVANEQVIVTDNQTPIGVTLSGSDVETSSLIFTITSQPSSGVISGSAPSLTYTPDVNFVGVVELKFKVNDGQLDSNVATVSIIVNGLDNQAPVAQNLTFETPMNNPLSDFLLGQDPENQGISFSMENLPTNGVVSIDSQSGEFNYVPNNNFVGVDSFSYKVSDGQLNSNIANVVIEVKSLVNNLPEAYSSFFILDEDTSISFSLQGFDVDSDPLNYTITQQPLNGTISGTIPNLSYLPGVNFNGYDVLSFKVNDGTVDSQEAQVIFLVSPINDAPQAFDQEISVDKNNFILIELSASDEDADPLTYSILSPPGNGSVIMDEDNRVYYIPSVDFEGQDQFTFKVNDSQLDSNEATVLINVIDQDCQNCFIATKYQGTDAHAVYIPGYGDNYRFVDNSGRLFIFHEGVARLSGKIADKNDANKEFNIDIIFSGKSTTPNQFGPKLGGGVNTLGWEYYDEFTGLLTGSKNLLGQNLLVENVGPSFQIGEGANDKTSVFGASGWFTYTTLNDNGQGLSSSGQGDLNLELPLECSSDQGGDGSCYEAEDYTQGQYSIYIAGYDNYYKFVGGKGEFIENSDGSARLTGSLVNTNNSNKKFILEVNFSNKQTTPNNNGRRTGSGVTDFSGWEYYHEYSGTLIGQGDYQGITLGIIASGPAFQVGLGANDKDMDFGASAWFNYQMLENTTGNWFQQNGNGDITIDLPRECSQAPAEDSCLRIKGYNSQGRALYLPGYGTDFLFANNEGKIIEYSNGSAKLIGTVYRASNSSKRFKLELNLSNKQTVPNQAGSKLVSGCSGSTNGWVYYHDMSGTLVGEDYYQGLTLELTPRGPAFQLGQEANALDCDNGASTWFNYQVVENTNNLSVTHSGEGDVNVDILGQCSENPEGESCDLFKELTINIASQNLTCPFEVADNLSKLQGYFRADTNQSISTSLPQHSKICDAKLMIDDHFEYDDAFTLLLNGKTLISSMKSRLNFSSGYYTYNWSNIVNKIFNFPDGSNSNELYCFSDNSCKIPYTEVNGSLKYSIEGSPLLDLLNGGSELFELNVAGDNDKYDCSHNGMELKLQLYYQ